MKMLKSIFAILVIILTGIATYYPDYPEEGKYCRAIIFIILILSSIVYLVWDDIQKWACMKEGIKRLAVYSDQIKGRNNLTIPGINKHLERDEIISVTEAIECKKRILLIGEAGVGKTGVIVDISNKIKNVTFLYFDFRDFANCTCMEEISEIIGMKGYDLIELIKFNAEKSRTVIILDQCDSIRRKSDSFDMLLKIVNNIADVKDLGMIVVCRRQESIGLKEELSKSPNIDTVEIEIGLLTKETAMKILLDFGIIQPNEQLIEIVQNLFNLSLLGEMYQRGEVKEIGSIASYCDFWEKYRRILESEICDNLHNCRVTACAAKLSKECILNPDGCCILNVKPTEEESVLISRGVIKKEPQYDIKYRFRHENMRDYMYCYDAIRIRALAYFSQIEDELNEQAGLIAPMYLQMTEKIQPDKITDLITKVLGNE